MNLFYHHTLDQDFELPEEEAHHALKVLRLSEGQPLMVTDGKGTIVKAVIKKTSKTQCLCTVTERTYYPHVAYGIHLAIAPTKNADRMEWMVEKCVELGIDSITFMTTQHSERKKINLDRIRKIVMAAMKQSQQAWLPQLAADVDFGKVVTMQADQRFIAYVDSSNTDTLQRVALPQKNYLILIGPEGDFAKEEVAAALAAGFRKVSLGATRLRTETAGLMACHTLHLANG